jgi:hypothetical protein
MKKEIIIAAYREKINWIPNHLKPIVTIYRCGEPLEFINRSSMMERILNHNPVFPNYTYSRGLLNNRVPEVNNLNNAITDLRKMRELSIIVKDIYSIFQDEETSHYAEKITNNCINGREAEQWLNHIINRYKCLADVNIFIQAYPFDHCENIQSHLNSIKTFNFSFCSLPHATTQKFCTDIGTDTYKMCKSFWEKGLDQKPLKNIHWSAGAQFAISKQNILKKPLSWYQKVQKVARNTNRSGEILERLWWNIFGCPMITNQ